MQIKNTKLGSDSLFLLNIALFSLFTFTILRLFLLIRNSELLEGIPVSDILKSFLIGIRFDLIIVSYILLPLIFFLLTPNGLGSRKLARYWLVLAMGFCLFLGVVELDFYHEFHNRLNSIAYQYFREDPKTVSSMLWNGFPVIRYLLLWSVSVILYAYGIKKIAAYQLYQQYTPASLILRIITFIIVLLLLIIGARGGTVRSGPPLRWGDAFHSTHLFANHLPLNGTYTFIKALMNESHEQRGKKWLKSLPRSEALEITRKMILTDRDTLLKPDTQTILRRHKPVPSSVNNTIKNIVVILMESFSAHYVGSLGDNHNITPEFDKIAKDGLLFERFFSNGTHTHQGMFATFSCFPNIPGFEYLMQQPQGQHAFSGLPALLKRENFNDLYIYNGDFSWDNQNGFFRNQGLTNFVGRHDYINPKFQDRTWGVSDEDMFNRAVKELDKLDSGQPFFAMVQTLSNHTPYALPKELPFPEITDMGEYSKHLTAMKYSDWALGEFFKRIKHKPYYNDTLFVILGDHSFGVKPQISNIDLLRFHVPLLLIAPGLAQTYGHRISTVATQVDVVPTIVSLLGKPFVHQCWGRDILSLNKSDQGFGVIKPSGSDPTVALIKGDRILVKQPGVAPHLGTYQLGENPGYQILNDPEITNTMNKELLSYVETALHALYDNQTGLPSKK